MVHCETDGWISVVVVVEIVGVDAIELLLKRLRYDTLTVERKRRCFDCEWPVDSTSLIDSYGRSASMLEDRRQTARLNLVVSAPSTPVPVRLRKLCALKNAKETKYVEVHYSACKQEQPATRLWVTVLPTGC